MEGKYLNELETRFFAENRSCPTAHEVCFVAKRFDTSDKFFISFQHFIIFYINHVVVLVICLPALLIFLQRRDLVQSIYQQ